MYGARHVLARWCMIAPGEPGEDMPRPIHGHTPQEILDASNDEVSLTTKSCCVARCKLGEGGRLHGEYFVCAEIDPRFTTGPTLVPQLRKSLDALRGSSYRQHRLLVFLQSDINIA